MLFTLNGLSKQVKKFTSAFVLILCLTIWIFPAYAVDIADFNDVDLSVSIPVAAPLPVITIVSQPEYGYWIYYEGQLVLYGTTLTISAEVDGGLALDYQWYIRLGSEPDPAADTPVGTTETLILYLEQHPLIYPGTNYFYCVVGADGAESVVSDAVKVVYDLNVSGPGVEITVHPAGYTVVTEGAITNRLFVEAKSAGATVPKYQWYINKSAVNAGGAPVAGANGAEFDIPPYLTARGGPYYFYCVVYVETEGVINDLVVSGVAEVTVRKPVPTTLEVIAVTTMPYKTVYRESEKLNLTGMTISAYYSDGSVADVTGYIISDPAGGVSLKTPGAQTVTIGYTENGVTKLAFFTVSILIPSPAPPLPAPYYNISVDTAELIFPAAVEGYGRQNAKTVAISNTGNQPTGVINMNLTGDASAFILSHKTTGNIAVGGKDTLYVEPATGLPAGAYNAALIIEGANLFPSRLSLNFIVKVADGAGGNYANDTGNDNNGNNDSKNDGSTGDDDVNDDNNGKDGKDGKDINNDNNNNGNNDNNGGNGGNSDNTGDGGNGNVDNNKNNNNNNNGNNGSGGNNTGGGGDNSGGGNNGSGNANAGNNGSGNGGGGEVGGSGSSTGLTNAGNRTVNPSASAGANSATTGPEPEPGGAGTRFPLPKPNSSRAELTQTRTFANAGVTGGDTPPGGADLPEISPFADVSANDWYYKDIMYVFASSFMVGEYSEPMLFKPDISLNRGMLVTVLYRMDGAPDASGVQNIFNDVNDEAWYADAVKWAVANGLVKGYGDGLFGPEDPITREQLAVILYRYTWYAGVTLTSTRGYPGFADDNEIESYAKDAVSRLYMANIIGGKLGYSFDPKGEATRAETAAMLRRLDGTPA